MSSIEEQRRKLQELQARAATERAPGRNGEYGRGSLYEARIYSGTGRSNPSTPDANSTNGATQTRLSNVLDGQTTVYDPLPLPLPSVDARPGIDRLAAPHESVPSGENLSSQSDSATPNIGRFTKGKIAEQWTQGHGANGHTSLPHEANVDEMQSEINIRGRTDGISIEIGRGSWTQLLQQLSARLSQAAGFFRGGKVLLDVGQRALAEAEIQQAQQVLIGFGMALSVIRTSSEQTSQLALAMGLATSVSDGLDARPADSNHSTLTHFVYRGNLRSGQLLERKETIIVLGDVNPGAHVMSAGDILVWGRLRGIAHAGAAGDVNAVVAALAMEPTQLRIADQITVLPEDRNSSRMRWMPGQRARHRPEIAFLNGDQVVVEIWDESKPGGIMAFRK